MTRWEGLADRLRRTGVALQSPILVREMRALLRGRKFFVSHMLLLTVLAGVLLIAATTTAAQSAGSDPAAVGKVLYWAFAIGFSVVIIFLVPAFSCTAITAEREGKTLDLLLTTTIRPWEIIWGKLLSALTVILLFMASALPLVTVCFLFGGVSPWDLALLYLAVLFGTLVVSSVSLSVSAHCKESKASVVVSYVLTLIIVVGILILAWVTAREFLNGQKLSAFAAILSGFTLSEQVLIVLTPQFLGISIFALNFAAAANSLKPAAANRSTNLRTIWFFFLLGCLLFYMLSVSVESASIAAGDWPDLLITAAAAAAALLWVGVLYFAGEETILAPRLIEDTRRLRGIKFLLRAFMPGPVTGLAYAAFTTIVVLGGLTLFNSQVVDGATAASTVKAAAPVALFLLAAAGAAALFSGFGFRRWGAGLAAFGCSALLAFGPMIYMLIRQAAGGYDKGSTLWSLYYLSPVAAVTSAWEWGRGTWTNVILPGGGAVPLWIVSTFAYAALTPVLWGLALIKIRRTRAEWRARIAAPADGENAPPPATDTPAPDTEA